MAGHSVYATAAELTNSEPAIHQAPQICFDTAATDERGAVLACLLDSNSHPVFE
jgi:hypothetical protein